MLRIELPGEDRLPSGPARELVVALHDLYRGAGRPGLRRIAKAVRDNGDYSDTVSHETVSDMLNGKGVPRWSKLDCVVRQLAIWNAQRRDPEEVAARFLRLWEAAAGIGPEVVPILTDTGVGEADIAVQQLKRALPDPRRRIELFDLVEGQVQELVSRINDRTRHPLTAATPETFDVIGQRDAYEAESRGVARLLATGVFHGEAVQESLWVRSLQRLISARDRFTENPYNDVAESMRHYPAVLCLWAMRFAKNFGAQQLTVVGGQYIDCGRTED
jgi:hypothetical protein